MRMIFALQGMNCAACAARIEKGVRDLTGVKEAGVNFAFGRLTVEYDSAALAADDIVAKIRDLGYDVNLTRLDFAVSGMNCAACAAKRRITRLKSSSRPFLSM